MSPAPEHYSSARDLLDDLSGGRLSASDALELHIDRHDAVNPAVNAVVRTDLTAARARARELDRMARAGDSAGPLHGLPMTVKDTFDVDGMPAAAGSPEYARRPRAADAAAVARLRAAGAVIWGKTNTPYLAGDNQTWSPLHGRTLNPHDTARTPGGSSGGAAAALATGITPVEMGSDIGGSLRLPAHFCGVATLKPTWGVVPIQGHVPPAPGSALPRDLNVAGPMARNVADLRLIFQVIADLPVTSSRRISLRGKRIGVWAHEPGFPLSETCSDAVEAAAEAASDLGAAVSLAKPDVKGAALVDLYLRLLLPILASDMPPQVVRAMEAGRPIARVLARRDAFSRSKLRLYSAATHAEWLAASEQREKLKQTVAAFFETCSAIITPVAPATAFPHVDSGDAISRKLKSEGKAIPFHAFHSWIALATICHLPAVVIPVRPADGGLPRGVQIIGPEGGDLDVLAIAEALEARIGGFQPPDEAGLLLAPTLRANGKPARTKPRKVARATKPQRPAKPKKVKA